MVLGTQFAQNPNYTPTFLGGGEFTKVRGAENDPKGAWTRTLQSMLGEGCYMVDSAGNRLGSSKYFGTSDNSDIKTLENVRCKACDHKDDNGEYTLFEDAQTKYGAPAMRCSACGNLCLHDEITTDDTCTFCKIPIAIKATNLLNGKDIGPYYYTSLDDAMNEILHVHAGRRPVLKLLADVDSACKVEWYKIGDDGLTIDLAGHTLTLATDDNISKSDKMKFQNTSDKPGEVVGTVNVCALIPIPLCRR